MALNKPPVGTKVKFLGFHDATPDDPSLDCIGIVGTVIESPYGFSDYVASLWLDVWFEDWYDGDRAVLLEDDSEFEIVE